MRKSVIMTLIGYEYTDTIIINMKFYHVNYNTNEVAMKLPVKMLPDK